MSRYAQGGGNLVAANALQQVAAKENNYKEAVKINHGLCKSAARRIAQLERQLLETVKDDDESILSRAELTRILNAHRESLKAEAAQNVERERTVEAFVRGVDAVRLELSNHNDNNNNNNNNNNDPDDPSNLPDYSAKIQTAMARHRDSQQYLPVHQEALYREVAEALGEKLGGGGKTNGDDDDDDIEIQETQGGGSAAALVPKCPVTGRTLEEPVKNKVCQHVYSREGILAHLRAKTGGGGRYRGNATCPCPVGGCANGNVTQDQLERDVDMEMRVRREKRQEDKRKQREAASQADDLMDSEEEG